MKIQKIDILLRIGDKIYEPKYSDCPCEECDLKKECSELTRGCICARLGKIDSRYEEFVNFKLMKAEEK